MLVKEDFMVIQALAKRGVYQRDIAETVGVHSEDGPGTPQFTQAVLRMVEHPPLEP